MSDRRTVVVTGGSDGIGAVTSRALAADGVDLIVVGRSETKLAAVAADTGATTFSADFGVLDDVRALAARIAEHTTSIDVLLNNAGGTFDPVDRTVDGFEPNFQINHLAGFLLTNLLRERLTAGDGALVVNTSSMGNLLGRVDLTDLDGRRRAVGQPRAYGSSKLMNILFAKGITQRWASDGVIAAAVHPGVVASSFGRDSFWVGLAYRTPLRHLGTISPEKGAEPLIELARRGADPAIGGVYFNRHRADGPQSRQARDQRLIDGLWEESATLVGLD
ncbi:short-chain dehydrogenase [Gordonia spumicola]|uniref:Short-chain dehydrogenase n=1 Tax=Gordonia spumicola TaxID=589161 RepID=A0A7I9V9I8_9ACTN|nr:SDR family NAD(P)-dependent oxidoreductase [Gordonia spumicola]GEE01751.1 short-chain dehydrogenase [Gordonia spumicola]